MTRTHQEILPICRPSRTDWRSNTKQARDEECLNRIRISSRGEVCGGSFGRPRSEKVDTDALGGHPMKDHEPNCECLLQVTYPFSTPECFIEEIAQEHSRETSSQVSHSVDLSSQDIVKAQVNLSTYCGKNPYIPSLSVGIK